MKTTYNTLLQAAEKDLNGFLAGQGFDTRQIAAIKGLKGIQADFADFADRFLKPGTAGESEVREGHGMVGSEGTNSKGKKFINYYWFTPCEGNFVLHDQRDPQ